MLLAACKPALTVPIGHSNHAHAPSPTTATHAPTTAQTREREKYAALATLPPIPVALAEKYSRFDPDTEEPTHDKEGVVLEGKVRACGVRACVRSGIGIGIAWHVQCFCWAEGGAGCMNPGT